MKSSQSLAATPVYQMTNNYIKLFCQPVRYRSKITYMRAMRISYRKLKQQVRLAVGQQRVFQMLLRNEPLSRFKRLRKAVMYLRRNEDTREAVPLLGVITHIGTFSKKERFYPIKVFWKTKNYHITVNLIWGSRTIIGVSIVKPRGLNIGHSLRSRRKNLARHIKNKY
jgi:hypothetical protein